MKSSFKPVRRINRSGSNNPNYRAGDTKGRKLGPYIWIQRKHPRAVLYGQTPYVPRSIINLEKKIGRPLKRNELAHHRDGNKLNDSPGNLRVETQGDHRRLHSQGLSNQQRASIAKDAVRRTKDYERTNKE